MLSLSTPSLSSTLILRREKIFASENDGAGNWPPLPTPPSPATSVYGPVNKVP